MNILFSHKFINKKILIALTFIISIFSSKLFSEGPGQAAAAKQASTATTTIAKGSVESVSITADSTKDILDFKKSTAEITKDILNLKSNITKELSDMTAKLGEGIKATQNVETIIKLVNEKTPLIRKYVNSMLEQMKKIGNISIIKLFSEVSGITPKINKTIDNIQKSVENIEATIKYILTDLQVPIKEINELLAKIRETGVYDMFGQQKKQ